MPTRPSVITWSGYIVAFKGEIMKEFLVLSIEMGKALPWQVSERANRSWHNRLAHLLHGNGMGLSLTSMRKSKA